MVAAAPVRSLRLSIMGSLLARWMREDGSGPEGPQVEGAPHAPPDFGQAQWLEYQEQDDQRAEYDGARW